MPFIGNKPSAVPLTSADIADSIITSAKIVDATIANADIANSTINLTTKVTGTLPVANGGTGLAAIGTSLQVLRTNTGATALEYATLSTGAAAGQIIQVITATDSTSRSTSSTSFVTGSNTLSVSITPAASANKVFVICTVEVGVAAAGATFLTIFRDSTNLGNTNGMLALGGSVRDGGNGTISVLDSPSSTSAITYQLYFKTNATTGYLNANTVKGSITAFEVKG